MDMLEDDKTDPDKKHRQGWRDHHHNPQIWQLHLRPAYQLQQLLGMNQQNHFPLMFHPSYIEHHLFSTKKSSNSAHKCLM